MKQLCSAVIFLLICTVLKAQPVNDDPCSATAIAVGTSCNLVLYSATGATNTGGVSAPPCGGSGKDVWFSFTVPASGMFTIETASGTITDGMLAVYTGPCTDLAYAYCDDDSGPGNMPLLEDMHGFIPGSTVYVRFYKKGGGAGNFKLCIWDDNPPLGDNNDCITAQQLCTEATFTASSGGNGDVDDLTGTNKGCLTPNEHEASWYYFTFDKPGEFNLILTPLDPDDNYNFAVWGPNPTCPLTVPPIRCSYSNNTGATGINTGSTDLSEGVPGDGWVKFINVFAGETYMILIDNYSESGSGFTFDFDGPPTITCLDYVLPITLAEFDGYNNGAVNVLQWTTATEINNAWFTVEHAGNDGEFIEIGMVAGAGSSTEMNNYIFTDDQPFQHVTYYRLKQTDFDGTSTYSDIIQIANAYAQAFTVIPNPSAGLITINHEETPGTPYTIQVINAWGVTVFTKEAVSGTELLLNDEIMISTKGIYSVVLNNGVRSSSKKVVIY